MFETLYILIVKHRLSNLTNTIVGMERPESNLYSKTILTNKYVKISEDGRDGSLKTVDLHYTEELLIISGLAARDKL